MHKEKKKIFLRLPGSEITLMHIIYDFKRFVEYHCYHNYKYSNIWYVPAFDFCVSHLEKDQQPVVPQPTNYKPKVINDIKAQVNKGRLVILFTILNNITGTWIMYVVYLPRMHRLKYMYIAY